MTEATLTNLENITKQMASVISDLKDRVKTLEALPADNLEIKTDAGDFATADSWDGRRVVNTNDTTYKILINGAWKTLSP